MAITIKSQKEIELMRESCRLLADVFQNLENEVKPGMSTMEVNILGDKLIRAHGCIPNFLHYEGYPASICVSVNDEIVHGIPKKNHILKEGDIVSLDAGLIYKGYHSDMARTFGIGEISEDARLLIERTKQSFFDGIKFAKEGNHLFDISNAIDASISRYGYGIVKELVGHGIGTHLHEDPQIPNFAQKKKGPRLQAGMTIAVEPMINLGGADVEWLDDDWTVVTADGSISAHYENTILITDGEPEILTLY
ncbi:MAG: type I methionyl aminopeptidase [Acetatifactor sp.]|nr:type I methionyl aminopeptidase [Acetatifactor sp.]